MKCDLYLVVCWDLKEKEDEEEEEEEGEEKEEEEEEEQEEDEEQEEEESSHTLCSAYEHIFYVAFHSQRSFIGLTMSARDKEASLEAWVLERLYSSSFRCVTTSVRKLQSTCVYGHVHVCVTNHISWVVDIHTLPPVLHMDSHVMYISNN